MFHARPELSGLLTARRRAYNAHLPDAWSGITDADAAYSTAATLLSSGQRYSNGSRWFIFQEIFFDVSRTMVGCEA
jgi:hypothetical protein